MEDSFYSQFVGNEVPTVAQDATVETPFANRQDLREPYNGEFESKCKTATTGLEKKTSAATQYWLLFTGQQTNCIVAMGLNSSFDRNTSDYAGDKARYIEQYNKIVI